MSFHQFQTQLGNQSILADDDTPSAPDHGAAIGSLEHDRRNGYTLSWESTAAFHAWKAKEEETNIVEWLLKDSPKPVESAALYWSTKSLYVCGRARTGGKKAYTKTTDRQRIVDTKKSDCRMRLTVKTYPNSETVLGRISGEGHNHTLGATNALFTRLPRSTRAEIERLLRLGVKDDMVLREIQGGKDIYTEDNLEQLRTNSTATRSQFAKPADIRAIKRLLEAEGIRLAASDGMSVIRWAEKLRSRGCYVFLKTSSDPAPEGSGIARDAFIMIIQTPYQKECWQKYAHDRFAGLDATHNTTHYEGLKLFSLLARDDYGHGIPCAWMISSDTKEVTVDFFLKTIVELHPDVVPFIFMSDHDRAQMNSIKRRYPTSLLLLCWWHVLHAWQQHFNIIEFAELWELLKKWIRAATASEFDALWVEIQNLAPKSVYIYLLDYWLPEKELWSAVYRQSRNIHNLSNTNMLVEAWHHLLKGKFLEGKRNRRLDHLLHILIDQTIPYFIERHHRQSLGFAGPNLELKRRHEIEERVKSMPSSLVSPLDLESRCCLVQSQSDATIKYRVDLEAAECDCLSFPVIRFCKHLCIAQQLYPDTCPSIPHSALVRKDSESCSLPECVDDDLITSPSDDAQLSISDLIKQLSSLTTTLQTCPATFPFNERLTLFYHDVMALSNELKFSDALIFPPTQKVAPNQHSWTETADVMGAAGRKKKRKTAHTDPYSGGERSGQKAGTDARSAPPTTQKSPLGQSTLFQGPSITTAAPKPGQCDYAEFNADTFDFTTNPRDLYGLKNAQLQAILKKHGKPYSGTKDVLVERVLSLIPAPPPVPSTPAPSTSAPTPPAPPPAPVPTPLPSFTPHPYHYPEYPPTAPYPLPPAAAPGPYSYYPYPYYFPPPKPP